ncbi:hypothetical protein L198_02039 [Cryptococcus wingfieldii CBS 7118]|uniref:Secreted protein n=1 Tax=Cryptococcus wingfieldii CBS 7118 TaxID=1295528 RepID=A0A1E3JX60_9TREE|nr:hypothetical protein L198_02039 [Cryptococcus wingfieldii CBS 7118]ODO05346.1 hypothetical protein L198_02039 [Cryptococcus wingfieldii CBS 7118]
MLLNTQMALFLTGVLVPITAIAAPGPPVLDTAVVASIGSKYAKPTQNPAAAIIGIDTWQVLNSQDANEGSGEGQKRSYGVSGPGSVRFAFNETNKYTAETFRISYYSVGPSPTGAMGAKINPSVWVSATSTEKPTSIIQCVATATASMTGDVYVYPSPDIPTTSKQMIEVKCTGV